LKHSTKEIPKQVYKILANCKCLFIFDNAESYSGIEGIKETLPTENPKFDTIITSRHKDWGNKSGYGQISSFQLDIFNVEDSVEWNVIHAWAWITKSYFT